MSGTLENKVVLLAGGGAIAQGMSNGRAAALTYAREGARVFVVDVNKDSAAETQELVRQEGGQAEIFAGDLTKSPDVQDMVAACLDAYDGRIDVLHNNIGIVRTGGPVELAETDWDLVVAVNLKPLYLAAKYVLPVMEKQKSGVVTTIGSMAGFRFTGLPMIAYSMTKAAVPAYTRTIAMQYAGSGIRANCVHPGVVDTPLQRVSTDSAYSQALGDVDPADLRARREATIPLGRFATPFDIANAAVYLASDAAAYITGTELVVDGGFTARSGI